MKIEERIEKIYRMKKRHNGISINVFLWDGGVYRYRACECCFEAVPGVRMKFKIYTADKNIVIGEACTKCTELIRRIADTDETV